MSQSRIAIVGGSGFVGRHLTARLIDAGYQVRVITRHRNNARSLWIFPDCEIRVCHQYDAQHLARHFSGCEAVINLVGILNEQGRSGKGFRAAHVGLTEAITEAMAEQGISRYLHMSALHAGKGRSHYLNTKGEAELVIERSAQAKGLQATVFQPSVIFGGDDSFINRFATLLRLAPLGLPLACARSRFRPTAVEDVVTAFVQALEDPQTIGQSYQLCGADELSLKEIVDGVARTLGMRRRAIPMPDFVGRVQGWAFDFSPIKPFSTDNYLSLQIDSVCTVDGYAQLGIEPVGFYESLPRIIGNDTQQARLNRYRTTPST